MKLWNIFRRFWVAILAGCYLVTYAILSCPGSYWYYSSGAVVIESIPMPDRRIWVPKSIQVHDLRRWMASPNAASFRKVDPFALLYGPLLWLDWKVFHPEIQEL
jgi:hypothetical protein